MLRRVGGDLRGAGIFLRRLYPGRCPGLMMNCPFGACWAPHLFVEPFSVDYWAIVSNDRSHFIPSFSRYGLANFRFIPSLPVYGPETSHAKPDLTQSGLKCSFLPLSELPERPSLFITIIRKFPSICYNTLHLIGIIRNLYYNPLHLIGISRRCKNRAIHLFGEFRKYRTNYRTKSGYSE